MDLRTLQEIEDDGFITVHGLQHTAGPVPQSVPANYRCAGCHQPVAPDGSGHGTWCLSSNPKDSPRLLTRARHPATNIGE